MSVEIGTKMRLKEGKDCPGIEKGQVVAVESEPIKVCGQFWVKFDGIEEACPLDLFEIAEPAPKSLAELQESAEAISRKWKGKDPKSVTLDDLDELQEDMDSTVKPLLNMLGDAADIVDTLSAAQKMVSRPFPLGRRSVAPPVRRRRR